MELLCLRRVTLKASTWEKLNLKGKRKESGFRERSYESHSFPVFCSWWNSTNMCQTAMNLTRYLVCPLSITPYHNLCDREFYLILRMRPAHISSLKPSLLEHPMAEHPMADPVGRDASFVRLPLVAGISIQFELGWVACMFISPPGLEVPVVRWHLLSTPQ